MRLIIGLMSGTSVDAIDAALVRISTRDNSPGYYAAKVLHHIGHPWPQKLRQRILAIMAPATTTTQELCQLNTLVAHEFAAAVEQLLKESHTPRKKITALASHGQTVCHLPPTKSTEFKGLRTEKRKTQSSVLCPHHSGSTLQIGDPSVLATLTSITTIANFRPADMALGGQGAPLVPWTDAALLSHPTKSRCIQNIGGIANVTYLPPTGRTESKGLRTEKNTHHSPPLTQSSVLSPHHSPLLAFDTGPGNMLIDALISLATNGKKRFDKNGQLAARGSLDPTLFRQLQAHPYFDNSPPKSTGRELFGQQLAKQLLSQYPPLRTQGSRLATLLHTATRLTAWSIADAYRKFLPKMPEELILCGGGADNPTLIQMLKEELTQPSPAPHIRISRIDAHGIPNKAKEAASFALLAAATLDRIPANLPSVTGASRPILLGVIAPQ